MKRLLIIWHSRTGGSKAMAMAAAEADAADCAVEVLRACDVSAQRMLAADGYIFVCPENLASMSGDMKEMFDRCYYDVIGQVEGRPYAILICAGSDGSGAVHQIERIATGWRLKAIAEPVIVNTSAQTPEAILAAKHIAEEDLAQCREIGETLANGLAMGIF